MLPFLNNPKDLDPSYKTDLDFWDCFGSNKNPSYNRRNTVCQNISYSTITAGTNIENHMIIVLGSCHACCPGRRLVKKNQSPIPIATLTIMLLTWPQNP